MGVSRAHLIFVPAAGVGHLVSAVEIAKLLVERDERLSITMLVVNPPFHTSKSNPYGELLASVSSSHVTSRLSFLELPWIEAPSSKFPHHTLAERYKPHVRAKVADLARAPGTPPLAGFVIDVLCTQIIDVANEFGVPSYLFFTSNAAFLGFMFHVQALQDDEGKDLPEFNGSDVEFETASKAINDFSKSLVNMMKEAGRDLDAAANSIEPNIFYAKRAHIKYAFKSHIYQRMFSGFQEESYGIESDAHLIDKEGFFHQFLALREMDPLDVLGQSLDSIFGKFCRSKYLLVVHPKMEASFFGNLDQRNFVTGGGHPRTPFYQAFLKLAKSVRLLHRLAYSFDQNVVVFQVKNGSEFSEVYVESVAKNLVMDETDERPKVGLMIMPGFLIGGNVIQSRACLSGTSVAE